MAGRHLQRSEFFRTLLEQLPERTTLALIFIPTEFRAPSETSDPAQPLVGAVQNDPLVHSFCRIGWTEFALLFSSVDVAEVRTACVRFLERLEGSPWRVSYARPTFQSSDAANAFRILEWVSQEAARERQQQRLFCVNLQSERIETADGQAPPS